MSGLLPSQVDAAGKRAEDLIAKNISGNNAPPNQDPPTGDVQKQLQELRTKYDALKGKYDKEIKNADIKELQSLRSKNAELSRQFTQMQQAFQANQDLVKELQSQISQEPKKPEKPISVEDVLSEDEISYLRGEDLEGKTLEILLKLAQTAGGSDLSTKLNQIAQQMDNITKRVDSSEQKVQGATLASYVPDFNAINDDPKFHDWLNQPIREGSSMTNRDDLQTALNSENYPAVKSGINRFKSEVGYGVSKTPPEEPTRTSPEDLVEPTESFTSVDPTQEVEGKPYFTKKQVDDFYLDVTKGRWNGTPDEYKRIDKMLLEAASDGRVIQSN